jgi:hypothetical protein
MSRRRKEVGPRIEGTILAAILLGAAFAYAVWFAASP